MRKELQRYVQLVTFLGEALGPHTEVVLQDLTDLDASVVAIANGHVSGRAVGAPATDLVLKIIQEGAKGQCSLTNYTGTLGNGNTVRSSTFFIKNDEGELIGMFCVNRDISGLEQMQSILHNLLASESAITKGHTISETFAKNSAELTLGAIQRTILKANIPPERMSYEEKLNIIKLLNEQGVFLLKGAIPETAGALKVSEPTVYRYLGIVKKEEE